eukprot:3900994-Rhodomonas_salina.1
MSARATSRSGHSFFNPDADAEKSRRTTARTIVLGATTGTSLMCLLLGIENDSAVMCLTTTRTAATLTCARR